MESWYVATCKTGYGEQDNAEDSLLSQMFDTFNPKARIKTIRKGKIIEQVEPIFPGYIFVRFDPEQRSAAKINNSRGVKRLVGFDNKPVRISEVVVTDLKKRFIDSIPTISDLPEPGDEVEIKSGAFSGLRAIFKEPNGNARSLLLVEILGNTRQIDVENNQFV